MKHWKYLFFYKLKNHVGKEEKLLVMSKFFFLHNIYKCRILHIHLGSFAAYVVKSCLFRGKVTKGLMPLEQHLVWKGEFIQNEIFFPFPNNAY